MSHRKGLDRVLRAIDKALEMGFFLAQLLNFCWRETNLSSREWGKKLKPPIYGMN